MSHWKKSPLFQINIKQLSEPERGILHILEIVGPKLFLQTVTEIGGIQRGVNYIPNEKEYAWIIECFLLLI